MVASANAPAASLNAYAHRSLSGNMCLFPIVRKHLRRGAADPATRARSYERAFLRKQGERKTRLAEAHDRVDQVAVRLLQRLDGLPAGDGHLLHNEVDVLRVHAGLVNRRTVVLLLLFLHLL